MSFQSLNLDKHLLDALQALHYTQPTAIQQQAIPVILQGRDVMASAQTGTGKTASFVLPILQRWLNQQAASTNSNEKRQAHPLQTLILAPTRELAAQIGENVRDYSSQIPLRSLVVFGGVSINPQMMKLRGGVDLLVATPGRLLDLLQKNALTLAKVNTLVLDEADRMLDMGFIHDIRRVINQLPKKRQNLMFSATFSDAIKTLANTLLSDPVMISVSTENSAAEPIHQSVHLVDKKRKRELLSYLIGHHQWQQVLIFTRTKYGANHLAEQLNKDGIKAAALHGNKSQGARTRALADFKTGAITALVATDIAARGLDIALLPYVVNYELPHVAEDYVHRIGRTGRAQHKGHALSLVASEELTQLKQIEKLLQATIPLIQTAGFTPSFTANQSTSGAASKDAARPAKERANRPTRSKNNQPNRHKIKNVSSANDNATMAKK